MQWNAAELDLKVPTLKTFQEIASFSALGYFGSISYRAKFYLVGLLPASVLRCAQVFLWYHFYEHSS